MFREEPNLVLDSLRVHHIDWLALFAYFDDTWGGARRELRGWAGYLFDPAGAERFLDPSSLRSSLVWTFAADVRLPHAPVHAQLGPDRVVVRFVAIQFAISLDRFW
jgi:hypothetical protein